MKKSTGFAVIAAGKVVWPIGGCSTQLLFSCSVPIPACLNAVMKWAAAAQKSGLPISGCQAKLLPGIIVPVGQLTVTPVAAQLYAMPAEGPPAWVQTVPEDVKLPSQRQELGEVKVNVVPPEVKDEPNGTGLSIAAPRPLMSPCAVTNV